MKSLRLFLFVVLISFSAVAFAQSDAQNSFLKLKTLAGSWGGTMDGKPLLASLRVTSIGSALMHEMTGVDDPTIRSLCFISTAIA